MVATIHVTEIVKAVARVLVAAVTADVHLTAKILVLVDVLEAALVVAKELAKEAAPALTIYNRC